MFAIDTVIPQQSCLSGLDHATFRKNFNQHAFTIRHQLSNHPLLTLPKLIELAQVLPESSVEYNAGDLPIHQDPNATPRNGLSVVETVRRIEECRSWLVLKNVEQQSQYAELLDACLAEVAEMTADIAPGMNQKQAFIFVSSPNSVTPFHIDPENNFLLQIRGRKEVQIFERTDRTVISEEQIEAFFAGAHRNLPYSEKFAQRGQWFELNPGDGLHFPIAAPHWVRNGSEVSISFSITFQTDASRDRQSLHRFNRKLRSWGWRPKDAGKNGLVDTCKLSLIRAGKLLRNGLKNPAVLPGGSQAANARQGM